MKETEQKRILSSWLEDHRALLFKVVRAYAFSTADQDDLFQEIMIQVWNSIPNFKRESAVSTWLYRVSLNTALSWTRKNKRHQGKHQPIDSVEYKLIEFQEPQNGKLAWLYNEITKLDEIDRSITLLLLDGLSYKEMSELLGVTESNLGVKIHRIKKHLISKSKENYHGI